MVVMFWSVDFFVGWVDEWVHVDGCSVRIEIEDVEDVELFHEWFGMCLGRFVADESDDFLVGSME